MLELRTGSLVYDHSHPPSHSRSPHPSTYLSQQHPNHARAHGPSAQHYMSPTLRRPSEASTPLTISPTLSTLSTLSSLSSESPNLGLLSHASSPASDTGSKLFPDTPLSGRTTKGHVLDRIASAAEGAFGSSSLQAKGKGKAVPPKIKKERQTRIQEHLRTVKPGSPSPSASSAKSSSSASHFKPTVTTATKPRAAATVGPTADRVPTSGDPAEAREGLTAAPAAPAGLSVAAMDEESVQARLKQEKDELKTRLASHGINPHPDVLDQVMRTMTTRVGGDGVTVQSFLLALSSLDSSSPHGTPVAKSSIADALTRTTPHTSRSGSFNTLESPSTPSLGSSSRFSSSAYSPLSPSHTGGERSGTRSSRRVAPTTPIASSSSLSGRPASLGPSPEIVTASPAERRNGRLHAFGMRRSNSGMVAADIQGMGRVALAREVLVERLGPDTAEQAIAAAAAGVPLVPLAFGHAHPRAGPPALDAFRPAPFSRKPLRSQVAAKGPVVDERLGLVRSWLESSPELADEDAPEMRSAVSIECDHVAEPSAAPNGKSVERLADALMADEVGEIRVGGKSVRLLVRSKRRRVEEAEGHDGEPLDPGADMVAASTPASLQHRLSHAHTAMRRQPSQTQSQSRVSALAPPSITASEMGCFCGRGDEDEMVQCDDCHVWHHLACLRIPFAKQLPRPWFCTRCAVEPVVAEHAPAPPAKRLKVVVPTTPVFYREPTFVNAPPSPRGKGNFYHNSAADVVLAPSPQTSPSRRFAPQSPVHHHATPVTPQLGHVRADYAPRSPLFFRAGRSRMVSGAFDDLPPAQGGWVSSWDGHVFGVEEPLAPLEDSDFWHDMTLTPSRSLSSSAYGWEQGMQTPSSSGGRRNRLASALVPSTPSQDFLSNLHNYPAAGSDQPDSHAVAQRLFNSPSASSHNSAQYAAPSSPLSKGSRARIPSSGAFLHAQAAGSRLGQSFASEPFQPSHSRRVSASRSAQYDSMPSPKLAAAAKRDEGPAPSEPPVERKRNSPPAPPAPQAPSMGRSNSGLGMSFGHVQLDDLTTYKTALGSK